MDTVPNIQKTNDKEDVEMEKGKIQIPKVNVFYGKNNLSDCMRDILKLHMTKD